jgi:hypothetical protein
VDEARRHDLLALTGLTALLVLFFFDVLSGARVLADRDLFQYAYPMKHMLRDTVLQGEFPYWNRFLSAGQPMAANPAHEVFYPLTWLILLPNAVYGFELFIVLHLFIAAWSMYALLRSLDLAPPAAFLGALSFVFGGLLLSYVTLLPILVSFAWLPLICLFARRFLLTHEKRALVLAALVFALQVVIGEPTTILQTGILLGLYAIHKRGWRGLPPVAAISIGALLLGAVQALPMLDHAHDSVRSRGFSYADSVDWSTPIARLGELFHPHLLGHMLLEGRGAYWGAGLYGRGGPFLGSIYPGLLLAVVATAGLVARARGTRLVAGILGLSVVLAIGGHTPLWRWLYATGVARSLRYPEKFLLMGVFALTVFGARMLDDILKGNERLRTLAIRIALVAVAFAAIGAGIAALPQHSRLFAAIWNPSTRWFDAMVEVWRTTSWIFLARTLLLLGLLLALPRLRTVARVALVLLFILIDLTPQLSELARRQERTFLDPPPILSELPANHGDYRLFHHAMQHRNRSEVAAYFIGQRGQEWITRNAAMTPIPAASGVQGVIDDDFDATSLLPSADFSRSVWELSNRRRDWVNVVSSMSNVRYRLVFVDPREAFARAAGDIRSIRPVRILPVAGAPRYEFASQLVTIRDREDFVRKLTTGPFERTAYVTAPSFVPAAGRVLSVRESANTARIEVETVGRAFLVMSVTPHKFWRITIDGAEAAAIGTNIGYQGVIVPAAGHHVVEMRYRNPLILLGAAISLLTLGVALVILLRGSRPPGTFRDRKAAADQAGTAPGTMRAL